MNNVEKLLSKIESRIESLRSEIEELDELLEDGEFNPYDASGGNFDDAYDLGYQHGDVTSEYSLLKEFAVELENLLNSN